MTGSVFQTVELFKMLTLSRMAIILCGLLSVQMCVFVSTASAASWEDLRQEMVESIREDAIATADYIGKQDFDHRVMQAIGTVPRHEFVPALQKPLAYLNRPLNIGYGQTISQPYIVALMTDLLNPKPHHRVLEVGSGSGYQAAILSVLVDTVFTMEIIPPLGKAAERRLQRLKYANVELKIGDGYYGWSEAAPFDGIIVTAVGGQIPPPLLKQLKPGGRMVLPVGDQFSVQHLMLIEKSEKSEITLHQILPVRFVPLTGDH